MLGVRMVWDGHDVGLFIGIFFTISFGVFSLAIGALIEGRRRLISVQQKLSENETLAAVGRLSAGVAHEVRNPLTVIRSSAKFVLNDLEKESDSHRAANFIVEEVDRLNRFVKSLLDYAKPLSPSLGQHDLVKIASDAKALINLPPAQITITIESPASLDAKVDPDLFVPVLVGLMTNAVQEIHDDGKIIIRLYRSQGHICLEVADSGKGISDEIKDRLFDPFVTTKSKGTGLGLAMARRIVKAHDGTLEVIPMNGAGVEGKGACFRMTLPSLLKRPKEPG